MRTELVNKSRQQDNLLMTVTMLFQSTIQVSIIRKGEQLQNKTTNVWATCIHSKWERISLKMISQMVGSMGQNKTCEHIIFIITSNLAPQYANINICIHTHKDRAESFLLYVLPDWHGSFYYIMCPLSSHLNITEDF